MRRGFSDEIGSWKIIWTFVRASRSSPELSRREISALEHERCPTSGFGICITARPVVLLPQPDSPTMPSVSPRRTSKLMPDTALTVTCAAGVELDDEVLDAQHVVDVAEVGLPGAGHQEAPSIPTATSPARSSSASRSWNSGEPTGYQHAYT